jgi:transposase InsO family protein
MEPVGGEETSNGYEFDRYYKPRDTGSFGGVDRLKRAVKSNRKDTQKWLEFQDAYTIHKPVKHTYKRNRVEVFGVDIQWQADLVDMQQLAKYNDGYRYILMCIDVFSKYGWAVPLKTKTGKELVEAFTSILSKDGRKPLKLQTDKGTEFLNKDFQKMLKDVDIHFFTVNSELKASVVERWNRTIKDRMWRYFTHNNTHRYIDILDDIINSYNNSWHSSIKAEPVSVTKSNEARIRTVLYPKLKVATKYRFAKGDHVRLSKNKLKFEKGYIGNWTEEIFEVSTIKKRHVPVYKLVDLQKQPIDGVFYEPELQKVRKKTASDLFVIEKVLETKGKGKYKKHLVCWRGYPESFNSWVPATEVVNIV